MRNAHPHRARSAPRRVLSQTAEHALRASLYLARAKGSGLVSAGTVADALGTPQNYTGKILRRLARKGVLRSVRGPHGGFELLVDPARLSVARLVDSVDEPVASQPICLLGDGACDTAHPCSAHRVWWNVQHRMNQLMEETTLEHLIDEARAEELLATTANSTVGLETR